MFRDHSIEFWCSSGACLLIYEMFTSVFNRPPARFSYVSGNFRAGLITIRSLFTLARVMFRISSHFHFAFPIMLAIEYHFVPLAAEECDKGANLNDQVVNGYAPAREDVGSCYSVSPMRKSKAHAGANILTMCAHIARHVGQRVA